MLTQQRGNLLNADVDALVNTVNTVGVMGKGIALQFKRAYPENFRLYARACKAHEVQIGRMFVTAADTISKPHHIINFPTKRHWRSPSRLVDIAAGLEDLVSVVRRLEITSIAIPPLGCGNGGLDWDDVYPLIKAAADQLSDVDFRVFPPEGAPAATSMLNRTKRPAMTRKRAAMLLALEKYVAMSTVAGHSLDSEFSIVEAQKVAYFLQLAGWPSAFDFVPSHYGPYAQMVDQWLSAVEGHFISGYGDGSSGSKAVLRLDPEALTDAHHYMEKGDEFWAVLDRFEELVCGFEFPYGVELLSSVHYIIADDASLPPSMERVIDRLGAWSQRKALLFQPRQAEIAIDHLLSVGAVEAGE